jgi:hypothetical protein
VALPALLLSVPFCNSLHILKIGIKKKKERVAAQLSPWSLNVERPESGLVKQLITVISILSMEVSPTHPLTHHVSTLRSGVSAEYHIKGFSKGSGR